MVVLTPAAEAQLRAIAGGNSSLSNELVQIANYSPTFANELNNFVLDYGDSAFNSIPQPAVAELTALSR